MADFSIADILARGYQQRAPLLQQRSGLGAAIPALGEFAVKGAEKYSVMQAQKDYADFLSLPDDEKAKPDNAARGYQAALSLGIDPQKHQSALIDPVAMALLSKSVGVEPGAVKGKNKETAAVMEKLIPKPKTQAETSSLTPDEMAALVKATRRKNNPLPTSTIKARGPNAKVLAQALMQDENYSPTAAEALYKSTVQGATAEAGATGRVKGGRGFETESSVGTLHDIIQKAAPYVERLSPTKWADANAAYRKGLAHLNDPDADALLVHMSEIKGIYSQILMGQGVPTDSARKMADEAILNGFDPDGYKAMTDAIIFAGRSRAGRLTGKISNEDVYGSTPKTPTAKSSPEDRFNELSKSGMKDDDIYKKMKSEGY